MKRLFFTLLLICVGSVNGFSQSLDHVVLEENSYDFGIIAEEAGKVSHGFMFKNESKDSISVVEITASCGCLAGELDSSYIQSGEKSEIVLAYNPLNRPGPFSKEATVKFSDGARTAVHIEGFVTSTDIPIARRLPHLSGKLRFKTKRINLGNLPHQVDFPFSLIAVNESDDIVKIDQSKSYFPVGMYLDTEGFQFSPKQFAIIKGVFKATQLGYQEQVFQWQTDDPLDPVKQFEIIANVYPTSDQQEDTGNAQLILDKPGINYEDVVHGEVLVSTFKISNTGNVELEISSIVPNCSCLSVSSDQLKVKPNETVELEVTYDTSGIIGRQLKVIHLYSNAENGYLHKIAIRAEVEVE